MDIQSRNDQSRKRDFGQAFNEEKFGDVELLRDAESISHDGAPERQELFGDASSPSSDTLLDICCFGSIQPIGVRFRSTPPVPLPQLVPVRLSPYGFPHVVLEVVVKEDRAELHNAAGSCLALLNSDTFKRISDVTRTRSLQLESTILLQSLEDAADAGGHLPAGLIVTNMSLTLYGKHDEADHIGSELSRNKLYLQDPDLVIANVTYDNPQFLKFPDHQTLVADPTGPIEIPVHCGNMAEKTSRRLDVRTNCDDMILGFGFDFDLVMDKFANHDYLLQASVDPSVKATLYDHQREGLDFLRRRESLTLPKHRALWEVVQNYEEGGTQSVYRNLITGTKSLTSEDIRGGILADDMGLGKTIMMISAIVESRDSAFEYAVAHTTLRSHAAAATIAAKSTVLIVPSALLIDGWIEEINKHTQCGTLSCYKYHGQTRHAPLPELLSHDVILTTYGTVAAEHKRRGSVLFDTEWYRIVLDEAHMIRNSATAQFRAVASIPSLIRWCLTGTPIQNTLDDLGSLVSFLRIPILKEPAQFRRYITRQTRVMAQSQQPDFEKLRLLIGSICLRRNRSVLPVSQAFEHVEMVYLSSQERQQYRKLGESWRQAFDLAVSGHKSKEAHQTVLEALLRMRIYCNQGNFFSTTVDGFGIDTDEYISILHQRGEAVCHYCSCDVLNFGTTSDDYAGIVSACGRAVCGDCTHRYEVDINVSKICPMCKVHHHPSRQITKSDGIPSSMIDYDLPSKIRALCQNLDEWRSKSKSIVFSFWKKSLDLVSAALESRQFEFLRIDGTVPFSQRKRVLIQFQEAKQGTVLLMTLGTGAVGLNNLWVANRIHLLEPQWNPSIESQAIGRVVRLGQTQTVHIMRYIVHQSVEEGVQNGQLRKLRLAHGGFGSGKVSDVKHRSQMLKDIICPESVV